MSTAKHTPGPWTSYPCSLEKYSRVITAKGAMVQVAYTGLNHHDQVAMTKEVYGDRMTYGPGEETTANARLIVAAPDLLESLQELANAAFARDTTMGDPCALLAAQANLRDAAKRAQYAIAKAIGSEP